MTSGHENQIESSVSRVPRWLLPLAVIAVVIECLPVLSFGRYLDDWQQREVLHGKLEVSGQSPPLIEFFTFANGDPDQTRERVEQGHMPWWTDGQLKLRFFRPLSAATHQIDEWLWPDSLWLMHLHSLVWFLLVVAAAIGVYRDLGMTTVGLVIGTMCFAIEDLHAITIAWLANRNHLIAGLLVLLAFRLHVRWQTERSALSGVVAAALFGVALLAGESAAVYGTLVAAWAFTLHPGTWLQRWISLLPALLTGIVWQVAYRHFGFGTIESGQYVNPAGELLPFAHAVIDRMPLLLAALFGTSSSGLSAFADAAGKQSLWWWAFGTVALAFIIMAPFFRRDRLLQFWGLAMLLSLLPLCAATPIDRVLLIASFTSHGLIARFVEKAWPRLSEQPEVSEISVRNSITRRTGHALVWLFILLHVVTPVWLLPVRIAAFRVYALRQEMAATSPALNRPLEGRQLMLVNPPDMFYAQTLPRIRAFQGLTGTDHVQVVATGMVPLQLERTDDSTLIARPERPFLRRALAGLYRREAFHPGWRCELTNLKVEVLEVDEIGEPRAIAFRFHRPLDSASIVWMHWRNGVFEELSLPGVGEAVVLPAPVDAHWFGLGSMLESIGLEPFNAGS